MTNILSRYVSKYVKERDTLENCEYSLHIATLENLVAMVDIV